MNGYRQHDQTNYAEKGSEHLYMIPGSSLQEEERHNAKEKKEDPKNQQRANHPIDDFSTEGMIHVSKPAPTPDLVILDLTIDRRGKPDPIPSAHPGCRTHAPQIDHADLLCSFGSQSFEP